MKKFRLIPIIIILLFFFHSAVIADDFIEEESNTEISVTTATDLDFQLLSRHVAVFERNTKTFLFEKASNEKCAMASTTKIMTCTIILENCNLSDIVTVSQKSASTGGSRLGLTANAQISVNDLLYGLMLCSGNDAAVALAEHCGGSVEGFAELMNKKAQELSLTSTHFVTPHGLDNDEHYTTAHDFAILTDYALNNPQFAQIVGTTNYTVTINSLPKNIHNTNELLGRIPSVYGVKTGYTSQAGRCLITSAKQDNLDIIVVVLGADTKSIRTNDSANLINYFLSNYTTIDIETLVNEKYEEYQTHILPYIKIEKVSEKITPKLESNFSRYLPIKKSDEENVKVSLYDYSLKAPIKANQPIAHITININNQELCKINILSQNPIKAKTAKQYLKYFLVNYKLFYRFSPP